MKCALGMPSAGSVGGSGGNGPSARGALSESVKRGRDVGEKRTSLRNRRM